MRAGDIDHLLAQHVAHLFIRDSVSLFSEKVHQNDSEDTDHFENIQSTNWQTMRFKPPPPNSPIGWRVEFRPCEAQLVSKTNVKGVARGKGGAVQNPNILLHINLKMRPLVQFLIFFNRRISKMRPLFALLFY